MTEKDLSTSLLEWYDKHGRTLPWRVKGGAHPDPYVILVSEFMLQQTTVKTVIPYFHRFMQRFPTVQELAAAPLEEVYLYWQGLGYYTRAKSLHCSAQMISRRGSFPDTRDKVMKLKGIGSYTVASFLSLAFNLPETVIDGNVIRIICRLYHLTEPVDKIMPQIRQKAENLTSRTSPADYASAIMDLGAVICTPRKPQCLLCPWQNFCRSKNCPELEGIPVRTKPEKKKNRAASASYTTAKAKFSSVKESKKDCFPASMNFPGVITVKFLHPSPLKTAEKTLPIYSPILNCCCAFIP